jgi:hypothetical protein
MTDASAPASGSAQATATLTIYRTSPEDATQRQVIMSLDGQEIATLMFGQRATREIPAGHHFLRAYNTLVWKNHEFTAAPGDHIEVTIINRAAPGMMWMVAIFGAGPMTVEIRPGAPAPAPPA